MPLSIAEYYLDEIYTWKDALIFHLEEAEELRDYLQEVMQLNTVPGIAMMAEHQLATMFNIREVLHDLKAEGERLQKSLQQELRPVSNDQVTNQMNQNQRNLRARMFAAEKEFLDIRYKTNEFIAEAVSRQHIKSRR
jgi:hypothetical protein